MTDTSNKTVGELRETLRLIHKASHTLNEACEAARREVVFTETKKHLAHAEPYLEEMREKGFW